MRSPDDASIHAAGRSAHREYQRRRAARRQRATARYGTLGALFVNVTADPATIQAWAQGAGGELQTARQLARFLRRSDVIVIHDRRIPGRGRANIDHLAIGPGGITIIDTKSTHGHVQLATSGIIHHHEILLVNGRDRTSQLDPLQRQITTVTTRLARHGLDCVDVRGALCYANMRRGLLHANRARDGLIVVDDPRHVAKLANRRGELTLSEIERLADTLCSVLPPAG
jgi:hypothetical protein